MLEIILSLGALGTILSIIAAILFFFLPFYVAGIYYRVIKCQQELEKMNQSIKIFEIAKKETLNAATVSKPSGDSGDLGDSEVPRQHRRY